MGTLLGSPSPVSGVLRLLQGVPPSLSRWGGVGEGLCQLPPPWFGGCLGWLWGVLGWLWVFGVALGVLGWLWGVSDSPTAPRPFSLPSPSPRCGRWPWVGTSPWTACPACSGTHPQVWGGSGGRQGGPGGPSPPPHGPLCPPRHPQTPAGAPAGPAARAPGADGDPNLPGLGAVLREGPGGP